MGDKNAARNATGPVHHIADLVELKIKLKKSMDIRDSSSLLVEDGDMQCLLQVQPGEAEAVRARVDKEELNVEEVKTASNLVKLTLTSPASDKPMIGYCIADNNSLSESEMLNGLRRIYSIP